MTQENVQLVVTELNDRKLHVTNHVVVSRDQITMYRLPI